MPIEGDALIAVLKPSLIRCFRLFGIKFKNTLFNRRNPDYGLTVAIATTMKAVFVSFALVMTGIGLAACGSGTAKTDTAPLGTYEILSTSKVPEGVREFNAQDLSAAREEPTRVLNIAYEGALAQFTEKHGREPLDDLETAAAICDWVAFNLRHPYFYPEDLSLPRIYPQTFDPAYTAFNWDPVEIIRYTLGFDLKNPPNWPSPFCTHQNFAAAGILNHAGLHARVCTVVNHDGLEYYSWKYKKWIWCDSTFNEHFVLSRSDGTFEPLGVKELQELTLFGGINSVQMVKHGYPDGTNPNYNFLDVSPHGFRRYAPFFYMNTLNGEGRNLRRADVVSSRLPIPENYVPAPDEFVELELDPNSVFSLMSYVQDPRILDVPLNALTLGHVISPQRDLLVINLRTWLPHTARFEVQYGDGAPWKTLESIPNPIGTPQTSSSFAMPWSAGVVSFRARDRIGNTSETLTILLMNASSN